MYRSSLQISVKSGLSQESYSQHLCIKETSLLGHSSGRTGRKPSTVMLWNSRVCNSPLKGTFLVSISKHTIAKLHTSALCGCAIGEICAAPSYSRSSCMSNASGAIQLVVPTFFVWWECLVIDFFILDAPKSASFTVRYPSSYSSSGTSIRRFTKMFLDLTSRCTMLLLCKYLNPRAIWSIRSTAAGVDSGAAATSLESSSESSSESSLGCKNLKRSSSMRSMTREYSRFCKRDQQTVLTTWGWQRTARISASTLKPSPLAPRNTFLA